MESDTFYEDFIAAKAEPISVIWRDYLKKCSVFSSCEKWIQHPFT